MARIFLDANESRNGALAANDIVFGNTGTETVGVNTGATNVRVEGTIEAVTLPGAPSAFTYRAEGNNLVVFSNGVQIARIIVQDDANGTTINFNGGSVTANVGAGGLTLGGSTVPTTAGPVVPVDFDENAQLTAGLNGLADAQEARAEFLASDEADLDDDETTPTTEADIEKNLADAQAALAAQPSAARLDADVTDAQADLSDAQDDVDAVAGLNQAINDFRTAAEDFEAAEETFDRAGLELGLAEERYEDLNDTTLDYTTDADGNITVTDSDGNVILETEGDTVVLGEGVDETRNEGVTQLLAAVRAYVPAVENYTEAGEALERADETLDLADADPAADAQREALEEFRAASEAYEAALGAYVAGNATSEAALVATYNELVESGADRDVVAVGTNAEYAAAIDAASADIQDEIAQTEGELEADLRAADVENPLYDQLVAAETALADAEDAVEARAELVSDVQDAQDLVDQLDALNADIDAATAAIEDLGYETPIVLDGASQGTSGNDIFVAAGEDATVTRFGRTGDDLLFIGSDFSLVELETGDDLEDDAFGSATSLEAFIQQVGANTVISIENQPFQGNEADGSFDGYTITLTGVTAANVTFDNGYFSIA